MNVMLDTITQLLDRLFTAGVSPLIRLLCQGLETCLLGPLATLGAPPAFQVVAMGVLFAMLSRRLRKWLRVEKYEARFTDAFNAKRDCQRHLNDIPDWKLRDSLFRATDSDLDEDYNTYLAHRFAQHGIIYVLPVLFALAWLDNLFSPHQALPGGGEYLLRLPANSFGIAGLSVAFLFLAGYLTTLAVASQWHRLHGRCPKRPLAADQPT